MNEIERIVKQFIPKKDVYIIPILVKELEIYCRSKENESFSEGRRMGNTSINYNISVGR